jgi:hypothetical protein
VVLPGAFRKIIDTLKSSPSIGQVRCPYYHVNEKGRPTRDSFRRSCKEVSKKTNKKRRHKRNLVVHGPTMNHLQAYRRDALQVVGQFNEKIKEYFSYEMALRIASRYEVRQIPEFLCAVRLPSSNGGRPTLYSRIKFFGYRLYLIYQLRKGSDVRYLKERTYNPIWLFFLLLGRGLGELWEGWVESAAKVFRSRIMSF